MIAALSCAALLVAPQIVWHDVRTLTIEGQAFTDVAAPFDRLPARAETMVRAPVWGLSHDSAGLCVRFSTAAPELHVRWTLTRERLAMPHMPATGVSGLDLYVRVPDGGLRWLATPRPTGRTTTARLFAGLPREKREFVLYLPLYNGVSAVELGVAEGEELLAAAPRAAERRLPIVFYGTSITQGGCASRPGMCHTAILGRRLERPVVNLGFSGNGTLDPEVADLLAEVDAAAYVLDCLPNLGPEGVTERAAPFVRRLRQKRATTPILLVEDRNYADAFLNQGRATRNRDNRRALRASFEELRAAGVPQLFYLPGDRLLGADGEDTVDGSHPTDLGFVRQADAFEPVLGQMLEVR